MINKEMALLTRLFPTNIANLLRKYPNSIIQSSAVDYDQTDNIPRFTFVHRILYEPSPDEQAVAYVTATMYKGKVKVGNYKTFGTSNFGVFGSYSIGRSFADASLEDFFSSTNEGHNPYITNRPLKLTNILKELKDRSVYGRIKISGTYDNEDYYYIVDRLRAFGHTIEYIKPIAEWMESIELPTSFAKTRLGSGMTRQYSIKDIAKYKAGGEGYGDWIANLNALQQGKGYVTGVPTPEYYIGDVPPQDGSGLENWIDNHLAEMYKFNNAVGIDGLFGSGLKNNISDYNKRMPKKKFGNTDTQLFEGMLGGSMEEMGLNEMEGGAWHDWLANLYNVIRNPKEALKSEPKPIWEFNNKYGTYDIISMEVCREPLSAGLQNVIDRASRGDLIKNLASSPYDALYHLYANVYLKHSTTGQTKSFRIEKNQRVEIFDKIVPPKGGVKGKCMGVPNIKPNTAWRDFWKNTDETTWNYSANKYNCQNFLKRRLEELNLLTPELKDFIMQDIDTLLPGAEVQKSIAKGITDAASILQNIWKGGEMCNCGDKCGCGQVGGYVDPHVHFKDGIYPDVTGNNTGYYMSKYYNKADDIRRQAGMGKKKKKKM